ncbi:hypothetical protein HYH03_014844 [Edaphochlamys debaryana]|uniref:Mitochondrial carrier protein n=1 Tax=Edaphochlamys debaryana TaxID=47281 RepID=A0A835XM08_9CHLO|nr:hypothetical protein HYH03_014844 [Edaphochlamys debaryana]|eukprot:KAG2486543.1 hypothetical protein HYH03_014844 [Edaphochlamys debaryana]
MECWEAIAAQSAAASWRCRCGEDCPSTCSARARPAASRGASSAPSPSERPLAWLPSLADLLVGATGAVAGLNPHRPHSFGQLPELSARAIAGDPPSPGSSSTAPERTRKRNRRAGSAPAAPAVATASLSVAAASSSVAAASSAAAPAWMHALTVAAGAASRTLAQVCIHPLDTLKTRLQVSGAALPPQLAAWRSVFGSACSATRGRALAAWSGPAGVRDLFLGVSGAVGGTLPAAAIYFSAEGAVRDAMARALGCDREAAPCKLVASAAAATLSAFVRVPADVLKHRVQAYAYPSVTAAARDILRTRGLRGMYAGFGATLLRDAPELIIQFWAYSALRGALAQHRAAAAAAASQDGGNKSAAAGGGAAWAEPMVLGGAAGAVASLATTPLDVVKTQLQCGGAASVPAAVRGIMAGPRGAAALFSGLGPRLLQTTVASALFFACFEASKAHLAGLAAAQQAQAAVPAAAVGGSAVPAAAVLPQLDFALAARRGCRRVTSDLWHSRSDFEQVAQVAAA